MMDESAGVHASTTKPLCTSQALTLLHALRCGAGFESPQIAKGCLQDGGYQALPSSDVYALGLLMLNTVGGHQPQQQIELQCSTAYLAELQAGFPDPIQVEVQRKHLKWLRDLLVEPDYADLVSTVPIIQLSKSTWRRMTTCVKPICIMLSVDPA